MIRSHSSLACLKQSNLIPFVEEIEHRLLAIRDVSQPKLHDQRIFVCLLDYPRGRAY